MIEVVSRAFLGTFALAIFLLSGCTDPVPRNNGHRLRERPERLRERPAPSYLSRRAAFSTKLRVKGPAPQEWEKEAPPENVREVTFPSSDLQLKAWVYVPNTPGDNRHPAIVYFHGGFAFGASDFLDCKPFVDTGFVVMTPILRGENGNPGEYEMFFGEVDDGVAAVKWLREQPFVDPDRIYTFDHSAGGVISALLSLAEDVPIQHGGSSGGLYGTDLFDHFTDWVPFNLEDPAERELRVLPGNIAWMKRQHYAFVGRDDELVMSGVARARKEIGSKESSLEIILLPGDHSTSLPTAAKQYIDVILGRREATKTMP
jgi:dienelactone hydrolase